MKPTTWILGVLIVLPIFGSELVTDEATRLRVLKAAFPKALISVSRKPALDWKPFRWPGQPLADALEGEPEYSVVSLPDKFEEGWAADLTGDSDYSHERRLRLRVFEIPTESPSRQYVGIAHYKFTGIQTHPFCCEWFTRIFVAIPKNGRWIVDRTQDSLTYRAKTVRSFKLIDVDGDGQDEIVVECENTAGGYYQRWFTMTIFSITDTKLVKVAETDTLSTSDNERADFERSLDIGKSRLLGGTGFCFKTTTYGNETERYPAAQS